MTSRGVADTSTTEHMVHTVGSVAECGKTGNNLSNNHDKYAQLLGWLPSSSAWYRVGVLQQACFESVPWHTLLLCAQLPVLFGEQLCT